MPSPSSLNIAFVTSEAAPWIKSGGLADVSAALPRALHAAGQDVRVFLPFYRRVDNGHGPFEPVETARNVAMELGPHTYTWSLLSTTEAATGRRVYFIHCPALYDREELYTGDPDEAQRFLLLTRAAIESCQRMGWAPDIFHCHDWQTALTPVCLRDVYGWDRLFAKTKTLLTIHNLGYQGIFSAAILNDLGLAHGLFNGGDLLAGRLSFLRTGLDTADFLSTVSPTYATEIQTESHGFGLHEVLRARAGAITGILNGVDYGEWDPAHDRHIPHPYTRDRLDLKAKNREALLASLGLAPASEAPVIGIVSRLVYQKGLDLLWGPMPEILSRRDARLAVLGSGEADVEAMFARFQAAFPGRVSFYQGFSENLAHLIEAGSDIFLMPSRYEPCGLNQMYSLRYGTLPIVRRTGGLADTVEPFDGQGGGTGFVFDHFTADGLAWALNLALDVYRDRTLWARLVDNAMSRDFSWETQGRHYLELYRHLLAG